MENLTSHQNCCSFRFVLTRQWESFNLKTKTERDWGKVKWTEKWRTNKNIHWHHRRKNFSKTGKENPLLIFEIKDNIFYQISELLLSKCYNNTLPFSILGEENMNWVSAWCWDNLQTRLINCQNPESRYHDSRIRFKFRTLIEIDFRYYKSKKSHFSVLAGTRSISFCYSFVKNTKHLWWWWWIKPETWILYVSISKEVVYHLVTNS